MAGFYGKLPAEGDFVTRRLPWEFTSAWDHWLQQGLQASRETLGAQWLESYLSAPIWRFQLAAGVCGPMGWRGLFFASVDRVGRYFPLTLAFADGGEIASSVLSGDADAWIVVEDAALAALEPTLPVDEFDRVAEALAMPGGVASGDISTRWRLCLYTAGSDDVAARGMRFESLPPPGVFAELILPTRCPRRPSRLRDL